MRGTIGAGILPFGHPAPLPKPLIDAVVFGRRKVALQIHAVVQNAHDLDDASCGYPVQKQVPSATAVSGNMKRAETSRNLVPAPGPGNVGTVGKLADGLEQYIPIKSRLVRSEILSASSDEICEIELRGGAEPNAPVALDHEAPYSAVLEMTLSERSFK